MRRIFGKGHRDHEVTVDGIAIVPGDPARAMAAGVAYVPEDRPREALFPDLDISENLSIAQQGDSTRGLRISATLERRRARDLISAFAVKAASERLPLTSLSGGNQQKVILARWMQRHPKVLLLDEPTQGVDVGARQELHRLIRTAASSGAAVLIASWSSKNWSPCAIGLSWSTAAAWWTRCQQRISTRTSSTTACTQRRSWHDNAIGRIRFSI